MSSEALARCRVVLIRPEVAANIGAVARAMGNFGLRDLVLVDPKADPSDPDARRLSRHGEPILNAARLAADFTSAVEDCVMVVGTSARCGGLFRDQSQGRLDEVMPKLIAGLQLGPAAIVFGPEPSGLTNEEVARCNYLAHIPTDAECPALNLAQSVAICLYEFRRHCPSDSPPAFGEAASFAEQERMFVHLRQGLEAIHFLYGEKADPLMHGIRHLISRAIPTTMEVKLLHGLARQLEWASKQPASS